MRIWLFLKRRFNDFTPYLITFVLILFGAFFLTDPEPKILPWLPVLGGIVIGAGFTSFATMVANRQAIQEQYNKDANLERKQTMYGPLYIELKKLRQAFEDIYRGNEPLLQWIDVEGPKRARFSSPPIYLVPTYRCWSSFKEDFRAMTDFTPTAQDWFNEIQHSAISFDEAVEATRVLTCEVLKPHIDSAIEKEIKRPSYQEWLLNRNNDIGNTIQKQHPWFPFIYNFTEVSSTAASLPKPLGQTAARSWIEIFPVQTQPATLGWLLAGKPDRAAQYIYDGYLTFPSTTPPPLAWFQDIFQAAWPGLESNPAYQNVKTIQEKLFEQVQTAEKELERGIQRIRDRYEGGEPFV